ncbi:MAG: alpha/beta hydrolase [Cellvibrionaceae bacterium]
MQPFLYPILLVLCISGCTSYSSISQIAAMPEPLIYSDLNIKNYFFPRKLKENKDIFYITDREPTKKVDIATYYNSNRSSILRVGSGEVQSSILNNKNKINISKIDEYGYLTAALPYGKLTSRSDDHLKKIPIADSLFAEKINRKLSTSSQKDIYIYVHGYKTVFENPLLVSSEFWQYMNNDGVFIAYAWPATPKRLAYFKDVETAQLSGHNLRLFIEYLNHHTDVERIHIIGYSAGTRVVITAIQQLALKHHDKDNEFIKQHIRIGNVILAASDYDSRIFAASAGNELLNIPEMMTIYMSSTDDALGLSNLLFSEGRLGQFIENSNNMPNTTKMFFTNNKKLFFINASNAQKANSGNGHGYFFNSPWVSSDLLLILKHNLSPQKRGLIKEKDKINWSFSNNHVERLSTISSRK